MHAPVAALLALAIAHGSAALISTVGDQAFTTPFIYIPINLASAGSAAASSNAGLEFRLFTRGQPQTYDWLAVDQSAHFIYGTTPFTTNQLEFPLTLVALSANETQSTDFVVSVKQSVQFAFEAKYHVTNTNQTVFLQSNLSVFEQALQQTATPVLVGAVFGEPTPRNLPPTAFNPPIFPNNWINR